MRLFANRTGWNLATNPFATTLERQRSKGNPLLDLTVSNPTACGLRYDEAAIVTAVTNSAMLHYEPDARGMLSARRAVCEYYAAQPKPVAVAPERIILTTSTSEGYSFVFRLLCDPSDEVLVPHPGYPLFDFLAALHDIRITPYSLIYDHGWQIDFHSLSQAITPRTRAVVVVHPNNPTGSYVKAHEATQLNALCATHGMAIIADEVFLDYPFTTPQPSFAANEGALTFTLSGLSKISGLPQMKVAWLVAGGNEVLTQAAMARLEVIADTFLSMNTPLQLAAQALLDTRIEFQNQLRQRLARNLAEMDRQLAGQKLCSRLELEAGWYATLRVPVMRSDEALAIALMEQQSVVIHPGHFFDFESDGYLIASLMTPEEVFAEGMRSVLGSF